jgi:hypothetical protein
MLWPRQINHGPTCVGRAIGAASYDNHATLLLPSCCTTEAFNLHVRQERH